MTKEQAAEIIDMGDMTENVYTLRKLLRIAIDSDQQLLQIIEAHQEQMREWTKGFAK